MTNNNKTHAVAPNQGRNVHCICGAEYSLAVNLRAHIERMNEVYHIRHIFPNGEMIGDGVVNIKGVPTRYYGAEVNEALDRMHAANPGHKFEALYA